MANRQEVILPNGRSVVTAAQTVEELRELAVQMVSGPFREVIDLFMLDERGNRVTDTQPLPRQVRIVPTIRELREY